MRPSIDHRSVIIETKVENKHEMLVTAIVTAMRAAHGSLVDLVSQFRLDRGQPLFRRLVLVQRVFGDLITGFAAHILQPLIMRVQSRQCPAARVNGLLTLPVIARMNAIDGQIRVHVVNSRIKQQGDSPIDADRPVRGAE